MLTFLIIKGLKPKDKQYDVSDVPGLFLRVNPSGKMTWRINKSVKGKRFVKTLGEYPLMTISDARKALEQLTAVSVNNSDTFEGIYEDWLNLKKRTVKNWSDIDERMKKYILPKLGALPFSVITPPQIIKILHDELEVRQKLETIKRICGYIKEIETFAVNSGRTEALKLQGIHKVFAHPGTRLINRPSVPPSKLPELLPHLRAEAIKAPSTWDAIMIGFYTLLRPIEYCSMEWEWVKDDCIVIPAEVMKMKREHVVPISSQLRVILDNRPRIGKYVLTSPDKKQQHLRIDSLSLFFRRHGLKDILVPHGIRSIGRTWMADNRFDHDIAEMCLAHRIGSSVELAYNRTDFLEKRREVMQQWCDFVEQCLSSKN